MSDDDAWTYSEEDVKGGLHIGPCPDCERLRAAIRPEAEMIRVLASGPWAEGEGLPPLLRKAMIVRSEHYRRHAQAILAALGEADDDRR